MELSNGLVSTDQELRRKAATVSNWCVPNSKLQGVERLKEHARHFRGMSDMHMNKTDKAWYASKKLELKDAIVDRIYRNLERQNWLMPMIIDPFRLQNCDWIGLYSSGKWFSPDALRQRTDHPLVLEDCG